MDGIGNFETVPLTASIHRTAAFYLVVSEIIHVPTRNMAAYLRKIAIDGYIIQIDHADIKAMTAEIQKIGVNVNQIARRVNATGNAYQEDIEEIKGVLAEIWRLQRLSLLKAL